MDSGPLHRTRDLNDDDGTLRREWDSHPGGRGGDVFAAPAHQGIPYSHRSRRPPTQVRHSQPGTPPPGAMSARPSLRSSGFPSLVQQKHRPRTHNKGNSRTPGPPRKLQLLGSAGVVQATYRARKDGPPPLREADSLQSDIEEELDADIEDRLTATPPPASGSINVLPPPCPEPYSKRVSFAVAAMAPARSAAESVPRPASSSSPAARSFGGDARDRSHQVRDRPGNAREVASSDVHSPVFFAVCSKKPRHRRFLARVCGCRPTANQPGNTSFVPPKTSWQTKKAMLNSNRFLIRNPRRLF